jgi:hypothetical protein
MNYIKILAFLILFVTGFSACSKEELVAEKAMQVVVGGYNGTGHALQVTIDTTEYDKTVASGKFIYQSGSLITFNIAYSYPNIQKERRVTLKDPVTGKIVFSKPLPATGTAIGYQFIYFDGKELKIERPTADNTTNKLGFYVRNTESNEPFDILLRRNDVATGKVYWHTLAKNALPGTWIYADYIAAEGFDSERALQETTVYFTKPGTTEQWAFRDSETMSKLTAPSMSLPIAGEKGLVLPYFVTPGPWQLDDVNLFFDKNRIW